MTPFPGAFGRGCASVSKILFGGEDCLSEAPVLSNAKELTINNRLPTKSRFLVSLGMTTERHPPDEGHARAPMVLGPFAEPKEPVLSVAKRSRRNLVARGRNPA